MGRDLSWATKYILGRYTRKTAPYPLPDERIKEAAESSQLQDASETSLPEYLADAETFKKYLEDLWTNSGKTPYGLGDTLGSIATQASAAGLYDVICEFVISKHNPNTGLWGADDDISYSSTSAAMKLAGFFTGANKTYVNWQAMVRNCIRVLLSDEYAQYIVFIWNPVSAMRQVQDNLIKTTGSIPDEFWDILLPYVPQIIYKSFEKLDKFAKPDGGYSYQQELGADSIIGMNIGLGLYESDVDGTGKVRAFRSDMYNLLRVDETLIFNRETIDRFFEALRNAEPTVKNTNVEYKNNFEHYPLSDEEKPYDWTEKAYNSSGNVRVVKNPLDYREKSLCISGINGSRTSTRVGGFSLASLNENQYQNLEFDLMLESGKEQIYHISIGLTAFKFYITGSKSDKFRLNYVTASSGSGKTIGTFSCGEWHRIRFEYLPKGLTDTEVRVYIDGELVLDTNEYYNASNPEQMPKESIASFSLSGSLASTGNVYIDNIHAYVEDKKQ